MTRRMAVLKVLLGVFTAINFVMAAVSFSTKEVVLWVIGVSYGARVDLTPQLVHVIRMFGAWNLAFAFLGAMAVADPEKNDIVVRGAVVLLAVRFLEMAVFWPYIVENFGVEPFRLLCNAASYLLMAVLLSVFRSVRGVKAA